MEVWERINAQHRTFKGGTTEEDTTEIAVTRRTASENCRWTTDGLFEFRQSAFAKPAEAGKPANDLGACKASADKARDDTAGKTTGPEWGK
jgi:hypothetical protein